MRPRYTNLSSIEPHPDYPLKMYYADEVDAFLEKDSLRTREHNLLVQENRSLAARIAELEKALRTVAIIDLGFGVPQWFCGGCASYGVGPDSIEHKSGCIVSTTLGERA